MKLIIGAWFIILASSSMMICFSETNYNDHFGRTFDINNLKGGMFHYKKTLKSEDEYHVEDVFLVISSNRFFLRKEFLPEKETSKNNLVAYSWFDGVRLVEGFDVDNSAWIIETQSKGEQARKSIMHDICDFTLLERSSANEQMLCVSHSKTQGLEAVEVLNTNLNIKTFFYLSSEDGDSIAPVRMKILNESNGTVARDAQYQGWKQYADRLWIPKSAHILRVVNIQSVDMTTGEPYAKEGVLEELEYTVYSAEAINSTIHAAWFFPQFPKDDVLIFDQTVDPSVQEYSEYIARRSRRVP